MKCPYKNLECIHIDSASMEKTVECKDCQYYPKQSLVKTDPRVNSDSLFNVLGDILRPKTGNRIGLAVSKPI